MKKFGLFVLFSIGLLWAVVHFTHHRGLANQGTFESVVLDFRESVGVEEIRKEVDAIAKQYGVDPRLNSIFSEADNLYILEGDAQVLKQLRQSPLAEKTEFIEPNYLYSIPEPLPQSQSTGAATALKTPKLSWPNDPEYSQQWNLRDIEVESAWKRSKGKDVTVAVIDTGVSRVRDLQQTRFVKGYDFVRDRENADDDNGHGTHVAGTIAQSTNNGYGVAGIAHEASIMPLKVLSAAGGGTVSDIAEAIRFAADNGADVINLSLGGAGQSHLMQEAIDYAQGKGVVIIAAAGNANQNAAGYPARYANVMGVAALTSAERKAPYSNYGAGVDIAAPGGGDDAGILQDTLDLSNGGSALQEFRGTSMAAPHVAGVAALLKSAGVESPNAIAAILEKSARQVTEDPLNHYGAGRLDAGAALRLGTDGHLSLPNFLDWLRNNGYYLSPGFWFDGGAVAFIPKLLTVIGAYLLAWLMGQIFPMVWNGALIGGVLLGSSGLFFLKGFYVFDLPQWPMRLLGSSIPEMGTAIQGSSLLNPLFASVLIPLILLALLLGHEKWRWFAIGTSLGIAVCLVVSAAIDPGLVWLGNGLIARLFLAGNAVACFVLARLAITP